MKYLNFNRLDSGEWVEILWDARCDTCLISLDNLYCRGGENHLPDFCWAYEDNGSLRIKTKEEQHLIIAPDDQRYIHPANLLQHDFLNQRREVIHSGERALQLDILSGYTKVLAHKGIESD
jgi:hypothetical protein